MDSKIQELIEISRFYGTNKDYVIAGGGNTSYKNDKNLWIKASGIALADIDAHGFVCMSRESLQVISQKEYSTDSAIREGEVKEDLLKAIDINNGLRPSVETSLHEIIQYPFVIHTHPTLVNALLCSKLAKEKSFALLGNKILFIPYIDPGYILFKEVSVQLEQYREKYGYDPKIILLENHGIFVSADSGDEVKQIYSSIEKQILERIAAKLPVMETEIFTCSVDLTDLYDNHIATRNVSNELIRRFVKDGSAFSAIQTAFTPDHIVYCKARYLFLDEQEDRRSQQINDFQKRYGYLPKIIGIKNKGLLIIEESNSAIDIVLELILNMMKIAFYANSFGGSKPMTDTQIAFIENWEAENYRKKISQTKT